MCKNEYQKETQEKKRRVYVSTNTSDVRSSGLGQD